MNLDTLPNPQPREARRPPVVEPAIAAVVDLVAQEHHVPRSLILHASRCRSNAAKARQVAMYLSHVALGQSLTAVGHAFGRDRTTVSHACHLVEDMRDDTTFDSELDRLESILREDRSMAEREGTPAPEAVLRLLSGRDAEPFLAPHQVEAARMIVRLFERSRLRQRVTMSYDPARVGGAGARPQQAELAHSAAEARKRLNAIATVLPPDCWSIVENVCGYDKGLQQVETERGWPRRSAKLVLRIGLEQASAVLGLISEGKGPRHGAVTSWISERVPMFKEAL